MAKAGKVDCALGDRVMCLQVHGDAAFAGQGVVAESFGVSLSPPPPRGWRSKRVSPNSPVADPVARLAG